VADLARDYLDRHAVKKRTGWEDEARLNRVLLPKLGSKAVKDVTRRDIEDLHRSWAKSPYEANRHLSLWSKMFSLAVNWQWRGDNPASGIERFPEERRQRFLSPAELGRLAEALNVHPEKASANAIRLLMLTGARRGEVLAATWDQFDLQRAVWTKPSSHTKQKKEHRVPLSPAAMIVIGRMSEHRDGNYVFPGGSTGKPLTTIRKTWLAVCTKAGLPAVRLHDLRHSYASALAAHGYSLPIIGALLGHSNPSTTARYAHLADDPLREATERVAGVLSGQPAAATMPFTKSA
jgi:integrase